MGILIKDPFLRQEMGNTQIEMHIGMMKIVLLRDYACSEQGIPETLSYSPENWFRD